MAPSRLGKICMGSTQADSSTTEGRIDDNSARDDIDKMNVPGRQPVLDEILASGLFSEANSKTSNSTVT